MGATNNISLTLSLEGLAKVEAGIQSLNKLIGGIGGAAVGGVSLLSLNGIFNFVKESAQSAGGDRDSRVGKLELGSVDARRHTSILYRL